MAIIKKKQIKEMSHDDLVKRLSELKLELSKDKGQIAIGGSPANPGRVKQVKKTIARILTEINRRGEKTA
ncbi:50S ribosomal protein L29 [Candidatus Micrarchaeota archaeon RBG_16_36_9]|nr:MAG: 50S ribosomal protein L29 [Candidatus Micrarchaeota archaeon RBG_16_36_9]